MNTPDRSTPEQLIQAVWDGDPAAAFLAQLAADYEAVQRGPCPDCGALWMPTPEISPPVLLIEHEDDCRRVPPRTAAPAVPPVGPDGTPATAWWG